MLVKRLRKTRKRREKTSTRTRVMIFSLSTWAKMSKTIITKFLLEMMMLMKGIRISQNLLMELLARRPRVLLMKNLDLHLRTRKKRRRIRRRRLVMGKTLKKITITMKGTTVIKTCFEGHKLKFLFT